MHMVSEATGVSAPVSDRASVRHSSNMRHESLQEHLAAGKPDDTDSL